MPIKDAKKKREAQKRADVKRAGRTRNFATVVYPESAPCDWMEYLNQLHISTLISPLHDKDVNPDGELKKPHYHVMLMFESPVDYETKVAPIFVEIGGVGRENVNSARGYARYMCHLDNPEKVQYNASDVRCLGGADYISITQLPTDDIKMLGDIFNYVRENEIYSLAELLDLCVIHKPEWFSIIALSRGYIVDKYIKSILWERENNYLREPVVDKETGEIVKFMNRAKI